MFMEEFPYGDGFICKKSHSTISTDRTRRAHFDLNRNQVLTILPRKRMSLIMRPYSRPRLHYSEQEYQDIRDEALFTLQKLDAGNFSLDGVTETALGLEGQTIQVSAIREERVLRHRRAVLAEQERHREQQLLLQEETAGDETVDDIDPGKNDCLLAQRSVHHSRKSVREAREMGVRLHNGMVKSRYYVVDGDDDVKDTHVEADDDLDCLLPQKRTTTTDASMANNDRKQHSHDVRWDFSTLMCYNNHRLLRFCSIARRLQTAITDGMKEHNS